MRVRPAGRRVVPGHAVGPAVWLHADPAPLDRRGPPGSARVDRAAALHHAGLPAGDPDGQRRRRAGVSVVRPGARPGPRRQPSAGRLDHRGPSQHRTRPARRRRGLDLQPVHRRRSQGVHDDEPAGGVPGFTTYSCGVRPLPAPARRAVPQPVPDHRGGGPRAVPGGAAAAPDGAPAGAPLVDLRRTARVQQRAAARPEHRPGRGGDDARGAQHLRRLRRLRRDRAPRRQHPDRVPRGPHRARPGPGPAGEGRGAALRGTTTSSCSAITASPRASPSPSAGAPTSPTCVPS